MMENTTVETLGYSGAPTFNFNTNDMSSEINEISLALSLAQSELEATGKDTPGYGYNYSQLSSVIATAKPILKAHGLAITQLLGSDNNRPSVTTLLVHSSGQFFRSFASIPLIEMKGVNDAQKAGACYSYLRRYAFQAILGMSSEDNDASSNGKPTGKTSFAKKATPATTTTVATKPAGQKFRKKKTAETNHDI
jgi:hypothetical protein